MTPVQILWFILVTVYVRGLLVLVGIPEVAVKALTEAPVLLLMLWLIMRGAPLAPGWGWVLLFTLTSIASGFSNGDGLVASMLYARVLIYGYIILWAAYSTRFSEIEFRGLLNLIVGLWVLQIAASLYKMVVLGSRLEQVVGTIEASGGGAAAAFPLLVSGFALCHYLLRDRALPWLALAFLSALVGYASGKRAIYFHLPVLYFALLSWFAWHLRDRTPMTRIVAVVAIVALVVPIFAYGIQHSKQIAHKRSNAALTEQFDYAFNTAMDYETKTYEGRSTGRISTTLNLLSWIDQIDLPTAALGNGPSSFMGGKKGKALLRIGYAASGFVKDTASIGVIGMLALVAFYLTVWIQVARHSLGIPSAYFDAVRWGTLVLFPIFLALYFSYCDAFVLGGWFSYVHFVLAGWLLSRPGAPPAIMRRVSHAPQPRRPPRP